MKTKKTKYDECIQILQELHKGYPNYSLGQHLSTATSDYGDVWGMSDKEFLFALEKYKSEMELNQGTPDKDIDKIIKEGMNLDTILNEEEDDDYAD